MTGPLLSPPSVDASLGETGERILAAARDLAQERGFNAFSYKDIAARVGIRHPSIHHHFPTKADLGAAIVRRYREDFQAALDAIQATEATARGRLAGFAALFRRTLEVERRLCLCGVLGAELPTLPEPVADEVRAWFTENRAWLTGVVAEGQAAGELTRAVDPETAATLFLSTLEGGLIVARSQRLPPGEVPPAFQAVADAALALLAA